MSVEPTPGVSPAPVGKRQEPVTLPGGAVFADDATRARVVGQARAAHAIVLLPGPHARPLRDVIDADFESALAIRGALPAAAGALDTVKALSDQLRRAASANVRSVCVSLPPLARRDSSVSTSSPGRWWPRFGLPRRSSKSPIPQPSRAT